MYTLKVLFKDNTSIVIENIRDYEIDRQFDMFFIYTESRKIMIPRDTVKMIGRVEDFNEGLKSERIDN